MDLLKIITFIIGGLALLVFIRGAITGDFNTPALSFLGLTFGALITAIANNAKKKDGDSNT